VSSPTPINFAVRGDGDTVVISVRGDFDMSAVERFNTCVDEVIFCTTSSVVLDLQDVTFIDSSAISGVLDVRARLHAAGRELRLGTAQSDRSPRLRRRRPDGHPRRFASDHLTSRRWFSRHCSAPQRPHAASFRVARPSQGAHNCITTTESAD
jgi:anti-anti-sigma factor